MKLFEYIIINFFTTIFAIVLIFSIIGFCYKDDISNISNIYDVYNEFIAQDFNISDHNFSFGKVTIDKPSFNFNADKVSFDSFGIILDNNKK